MRNFVSLPLINVNQILFHSVIKKNHFLTRIEKDKGQILHEISDVRAATDEVNRSRVSTEQCCKNVL